MKPGQIQQGRHLGGVDLSAEAIRMRQGIAGQESARDMGDRASRVLERAHRIQRTAASAGGGRRVARARSTSREALLTAAVLIRMSELTPGLDRRVLHCLSAQQIQRLQAEVQRLVINDTADEWGKLAVDTHQRVEQHRRRKREE